MESHGGSVFYYLWVLPLSLLPFTGWLIRILARFRQGLADPLDRYLWCWFGMVFVFFSLSQTQLPRYMLYGATPLFILMARHREALRAAGWPSFLPCCSWCVPASAGVGRLRRARPASYETAVLARGPEMFGWVYRAIVGTCPALAVAAAIARASIRRGWY